MVIDKLDYPVFENDWSLMEELQFIGGLSKCGIDSWCSISEYLNNSKSIEELFAHFYTFYYDPLAVSNLVKNNGEADPDPLSVKPPSFDVTKEVMRGFEKSFCIYKNRQITNMPYQDRNIKFRIEEEKINLNINRIERTK